MTGSAAFPGPVAVAGADKDLLDVLLADGVDIAGVFDPVPDNVTGFGLTWLGGDDAAAAYLAGRPDVRVLLAIDPPGLRKRLHAAYGAERCVGFVSSEAHVSARARIAPASIVQALAMVSADVELGLAARINVGAQVHHDCRLASFVTVGPRAVLLGNVTVGAETYIGSGAVIMPRVTIGRSVRVGAGAVVARDVADGETVVGVPARASRQKEQDA